MCSACSRLVTLLTPSSYIEGVVRGYRNALLTSQNYSNLTQCETIDGKPWCGGASIVSG